MAVSGLEMVLEHVSLVVLLALVACIGIVVLLVASVVVGVTVTERRNRQLGEGMAGPVEPIPGSNPAIPEPPPATPE